MHVYINIYIAKTSKSPILYNNIVSKFVCPHQGLPMADLRFFFKNHVPEKKEYSIY